MLLDIEVEKLRDGEGGKEGGTEPPDGCISVCVEEGGISVGDI